MEARSHASKATAGADTETPAGTAGSISDDNNNESMTTPDESSERPSISSQIRFMQEEVSHRERALSHSLAAGRISQCKADREMTMLRAVLHSLQRLAVIGGAQ